MNESEQRSGEVRSTIEAPYESRVRRVNTDPRESPQRPRRVSPWVIALGSILLVCAALTACIAAAAGTFQGLLVATSPARATVNRQFAVRALPTVQIDADVADVQVAQGAAGQIAVTLTKETHAITQSLARQDLDAITLDTEQNGDLVTIRVKSPDGPGVFGVAHRKISLDVTLPPTANVGVTSAVGDVRITDIAGRFTVQTSVGNVTMSRVTLSGSSSVRTSVGDMEIESALAPATTLDLTDSVGDVDLALPSDTRAHVEAATAGGDASVSGFAYATDALTSSHVISIDLNPNPQSTITAHVSTGDLRLHSSSHAGA
jgi:hypothetical protein